MIKKLSAVLVAILICAMILAPATAFADNAYIAVKGGTMTFNKYLAVANDATIPAASFSFTIGAGDAVSGTTVVAGLSPTAVTVGTATFTANQATTAGAATDGIVNSTDKKYATQSVTVDFSAVSFTEPGIYRYILTEEASTATNITNDSVATRTIDVYVQNTVSGLSVGPYVMYSGTQTNAPAEDTPENPDPTKSNQFVNEAASQNLTFSKTVSGNQASKDKYFKFTVTIEGAGAGTVVSVDMSGAKTTPAKSDATTYTAGVMAAANTITGNTLTADADGKIEHDFYLAHGDSVVIKGLPKGCTYKVAEVNEDYTNENATQRGTVADAAVSLTFTNTRGGVVPTGVMLTVVPGVVIVGIALFGLIVLKRKKNKA